MTAVAVLATGLALAACEAPTPSITWYGNANSVHVGPRLYCTLTSTPQPTCSQLDGPEATLALHTDDPVQVNIPPEVASEPWVLVYSYADDTTSYRTSVITDGKTLSYLVRPLAGKQLKQIDLQILQVTAGASGTPEWSPYQAWVLVVTPA